jgi:hypothetical protein
MLAKYWKRIGLVILVVAIILNVINKFIKIPSFKKEVKTVVVERKVN